MNMHQNAIIQPIIGVLAVCPVSEENSKYSKLCTGHVLFRTGSNRTEGGRHG